MAASEENDPAGRAADSPQLHNLPLPATPLVGREHEVAAASGRLQRADVRLLTLTGPPGIGKTRLAVAVANTLLAKFPHGVYFVDLAPVTDAGLVLPTVAHVLGLRQVTDRSLIEELGDYLASKRVLLVLDNFEQVVEAAPVLTELLQGSPNVKLLVTSRELLRVSGEHNFPVPPLSLPPVLADHGAPRTLAALSPERLGSFDAVQLFVQRAVALQPGFALTPDNALIVAGICCRLDGLPLAIELAAARVRHLPPHDIYARLEQRLHVLSGGARDLPLRQRTLRNTIEWSYNLLDGDERLLFARLAIFRGGCSLEAAEAVCGEDLPVEVFDGLASLVDQSLVQHKETSEGEARFVQLEMIHEYAREQLEAGGELEALCRKHAAYFVGLAERAEVELRRAHQQYWFHLLEMEIDNLRAALQWSLGSGDIAVGIRIISGTLLYWHIYGRQDEGIRWTQHLLAQMDETPSATGPAYQVRLLRCAAHLISYRDSATAVQLSRQALLTARACGDKAQLGWALYTMGALDPAFTSEPETGELTGALAEAQALFRELDDQQGIAQVLNSIGEHARLSGDDERARRAYEGSLEIFERLGDTRAQYSLLYNMAFVAQHEGDHQEAIRLLRRSLALCQDVGVPAEVARELLALAGPLGAAGDAVGAARLFGAADAFFQHSGALVDPDDQPEHDRNIAFVRAELGEAAFAVAWAEGQAMTLDQATAYAHTASGFELPSTPQPRFDRVSDQPGDLTRRERECRAPDCGR